MHEGYALRLLKEKGLTFAPTIHYRWPFLFQLLAQGYFCNVDCALAETLLKELPVTDDSVAIFVCYLSLAARLGHICVEVLPTGLRPDPYQLLLSTENSAVQPLNETQYLELIQQVQRGAACCPARLLAEAQQEDSVIIFPLHCKQHYYYLHRNYLAEQQIRHHIERIYQTQPHVVMEQSVLEVSLQQLQNDNRLLPEQAAGIAHAADKCLTFITGGPGTGKTYTAGLLIQLLLQQLSPTAASTFEIMLAAPTGKAAANLQQSLQRACQGLEQTINISSGTLHRLLCRLRYHYLPADLIVVDESSMIDIELMHLLLSKVKTGARVVLLGDRYQLPPVESGHLFTDLIEWGLQQRYSPVIALKTCLRIETLSIADWANAINRGAAQQVIELLDQKSTGLQRVICPEHLQTTEAKQRYLLQQIERHLPLATQVQPNSSAFEQFQTFRVLSPLRQGPWGIEVWNQLILQHSLQQGARGQQLAIPIMVTRNDEKLELYNGDVGILFCRKPSFVPVPGGVIEWGQLLSEDAFALFPGRSAEQSYFRPEAQARILSPVLLPAYELAYCLSVHKSQGSEFQHVMLLLPEGSELFGREVLYTAATRAKQRLTIFATDTTLAKTTERCAVRVSGFNATHSKDTS